eukprot:NODE_156_length_3500_cov_6.162467.p1 GENE.NODE_156_length_3500_cov_6.162467~~NODE_156_length_3500_cov_6.162467.p1  ORF type:complete len:1024 (+),score=324.87 NODE_156_length_3500_cov_6.162467:351-3074(+)
MRCQAAIDQLATSQVLPAPLLEAREKFSRLCDLLRLPVPAATAVPELEAARTRVEDALIEARAEGQRAATRERRRGIAAAPEREAAMEDARAALAQADVRLVVEMRRAATCARLGLVEILGSSGLAAALRAAPGHGDPLLARLSQHTVWLAAQGDRGVLPVRLGSEQERAPAAPIAPAPTAGDAPMVEVDPTEDPAMVREEGLAGYSNIEECRAAGHVWRARRRGATVAIKLHRTDMEVECRREMRALSRLLHSGIVPLQGIFKNSGGTYLEIGWFGGGTLFQWCERHPGATGGDLEATLEALSILRQLWHVVAFIHSRSAAHGDVSLANVLLDTDHRPVLCDFSRCVLDGRDADGLRAPTYGFAAPEAEDAGRDGVWPAPMPQADVYASGVVSTKLLLGLDVDIGACPPHPVTGLRTLPDEHCDVDLCDLLQACLARDPRHRPLAEKAASHRGLDPTALLRRRGLLASSGHGAASPADMLLEGATQLREEYRCRAVDDPLTVERESVFDTIAQSRVGEWAEEALLGEWRVVLDQESGVDGGGLRREVVSLFFEQLERSALVLLAGGDGLGATPMLFAGRRQKAELGLQQWRQMWAAVGAMVLRATVHLGSAPVKISSVVFDCALGRIGRLPPDLGDEEDDVEAMRQVREKRGDDWGRSEMLDFLRRLRRADAHKESGYRWMLGQRKALQDSRGASSSYIVSADTVETMAAMLEEPSYRFLTTLSRIEADGSLVHDGAVLEWSLLWDLYLKYIGGGDRWVAYEAFADGLSAHGRRMSLWTSLTGEQIVQALEGADLTADVVVANLEFVPDYGYDKQISLFCGILKGFSKEELSMFLRFATGIGRLPASRRFPNGQKLTIRFMPDDVDRLPSAHTCFWVCDLPPYKDEAEMGLKLRQAIAAPQPFALS